MSDEDSTRTEDTRVRQAISAQKERRNTGSSEVRKLIATMITGLRLTRESVRERSDFRGKWQIFWDEMAELGVYGLERFFSMQWSDKLKMLSIPALCLVLTIPFCGGASPDAIREQIRTQIAQKDFIGARQTLVSLQQELGELGPADIAALQTPIIVALKQQLAAQKAAVKKARKQKKWDEALKLLEETQILGDVADARGWSSFQKAEILRVAERKDEAAAAYQAYLTAFPETSLSDDAMFWSALFIKDTAPATAKELLQKMLKSHPKSNFRTSAKRLVKKLK